MHFRWLVIVMFTAVGGSLYLFHSIVDAADRMRPVAQATALPALQISKVSEPTIVTAGQLLTYTIRITNTTNQALQNIVISDPLPAGVETNGPATIHVINGAAPAIQVSPQQITGTVSSLGQGGMIFLTIHAAVSRSAAGTAITNRVTINAMGADQTPRSNFATVQTGLIPLPPTATPTPSSTPAATPTLTPTTTQSPTPTATAPHSLTPTLVSSATATSTLTPSPTVIVTPTAVPDLADLQIGQSAIPAQFVAGALLTYTLVITNHGPGIAHDLVIQNTLPRGLHLEGPSRMSIAGGETPKLLLSRTTITGTAVLLQSGGSIRIAARTRVEADFQGDELVNEVGVTALTPDQNRANNRMSLLTERLGKKVGEAALFYLPLIQRE